MDAFQSTIQAVMAAELIAHATSEHHPVIVVVPKSLA
ncbi:hypothetical protein ABIF64_001754 [Bradyrhizobium japonicum]|jgi:hypothetical protein|nr:hypothetical protein [Bradyrhizobium japonicum]MCP1792533.1 hypothetical protein [Bradyrhizobium japonicum]MCP1804968.1 hypothetical protein [Bradyrhizobium japonicum]MCP1813989.1 hypothetical protein [Bradyrhizobium japonicum]MCP1874588.1 hypothetical protein [Bradyrhizobium japonicum]